MRMYKIIFASLDYDNMVYGCVYKSLEELILILSF